MNKPAISASILLFTVCIVSCGDPYDEKLPANANEKIDFYRAISFLSEEDQKDLRDFYARVYEQQTPSESAAPATITFRQALAEQRDWKKAEAERQAKERETAKKAQAEEEEKRRNDQAKLQQDMLDIFSVELVRLRIVKAWFGKSFAMDLKITNQGKKKLLYAAGAVQLLDASDHLLKEIKTPFSKPLNPGQSAISSGKFAYIGEKPGDVTLAKTPVKKLKTKWIPSYCRFADGSQIGEEPKNDSKLR